tara:strand:- start:226 stop:966 length:741 start_codon:yes stop_codon:yes gene_type:complete
MAEPAENVEYLVTEVESRWLKLFTGVVAGQACDYEVIRTLNQMICHYACAAHVTESGKTALSIPEIADIGGFSRSFVTSYIRKLVKIGVLKRLDTGSVIRYASQRRWHDLHYGFRPEVIQLAEDEGFHFGQPTFFNMMLDALRGVKENTLFPRATMKQVAVMLLLIEQGLIYGRGIRYRDIETRLRISNADVHSIVVQLLDTGRYYTQRDPNDNRCQLILPKPLVTERTLEINQIFCQTWAAELTR